MSAMNDGGNGAGRFDKIDERIDKLLTMGYLHDQRLTRIETLFEENERRWKETWDAHLKEMHEREKRLDERVDKLVTAIGDFIRAAAKP